MKIHQVKNVPALREGRRDMNELGKVSKLCRLSLFVWIIRWNLENSTIRMNHESQGNVVLATTRSFRNIDREGE